MEKSFTHCFIDVISLVILICNKKLLSSCPTKINMSKWDFSQTYWLNWDILQSPNVLAKPRSTSDIANSRSRFPTTPEPQSNGSTPVTKQKWLTLFFAPAKNLSKLDASFCYIHSRSTTHSLRPCGTNVSGLYCQKSFFFSSFLLITPFVNQNNFPIIDTTVSI